MDVPGSVNRGWEWDRRSGPGRRRASRPLVWIVVGLAFLAAAAYLYHPPLVILYPGNALVVEDGIDIEGAPTSPVQGDYRLTSVGIEQPNLLGALVAWVRDDRDVVPIGEVVPGGVDPEEYFEVQRDVFDDSRQLAAVAGARAAGYDVAVDGNGARVVGVIPDSPAADALDTGDVVVAVDGAQIATTTDLREAVRGREAGEELAVTVDRAGERGRDEVEVELTSLPDLAGEAGLGVVVTTEDLAADLPFDVSFPKRDIGGPSAGLAYALAVADLLDERDLAGGRTIAATGTIGANGDVGPVGSVGLKAIAAEDAGADVFLLPVDNADEPGDAELEVRAVGSLDEALDLLRTTA